MKSKLLTESLAGSWNSPWRKLSHLQRELWTRAFGYVGPAPHEDGLQYQLWHAPRHNWDTLDTSGRKRLAKEHDAKQIQSFEIGFFAEIANADYWWKQGSLKASEAAKLLCLLDPFTDTGDPMTITTDETGPEDYKRLLRLFETLETTKPGSRSLRQWLTIAREEGLKYHPWIDKYEQVRAEELPDRGAGRSAKSEWVGLAWEIGEKWMLAEETRTKKRPSITEIAKSLELEFKRRDIRSKRLDDYLDWQTIKKEITGITGRKPGDNFKNTMGNPQRKRNSPT